MNSGVSKYVTQQVMTASPGKLVYMLYDRAIASLGEAIAAIAAGDIEGRWKANNRAIEIITQLWSTLDIEKGGEIARNLDRLFPFILLRLTQVDLKNDPAPAEEIITLLEPLRDSWRELAMKKQASSTPAGAAPDAPPANAPRTIISA